MSQVILVTGASSGFGMGVVKTLAKKGHHVYAAMRQIAGKNKAVADELRAYGKAESLQLHPVELDITSTTSVNDAVAHVLAREQRIDTVINNAGIMPVGVSEGYTIEQFQALLDTNVTGCLRVNQAVLPTMRKQRSGLLVHVSSIAGRLVTPFLSLYCASKFALEAMAEGLHYEVSQFGVESVIVEPGPFATNLYAAAPQHSRPAVVAEYGKMLELLEGMGAAFQHMFATSPEAVNPDLVVNKLVELVELPAGKRPLRSAVGMDFGVAEINKAIEPMRKAGLEAMQFAHLDNVVV